MSSLKNFFSGFGASDLMNLAGGLFGAVGNIISTDMTNKNNAKLQEQANAAQAAENEKAYNRSKATNQVALMQQAGMSRAGALNALNGGGSYTPAPVNASQEQAPHIDMSFLSSLASNVAQNQRFDKELGLEKQKLEFEKQKQKFAEQMENERNARENAANAREEYEKSLKMLSIDMQNKAVSIERLLDPTEFDSPASYRAALFDRCDDEQKKYFDNAIFVETLNLHHAAEVATKNTNANTGLADANTGLTNAKTQLTNEQINLCKASVNLTIQQVQTEFEKTNLTKEQAKTCAKQYEQIAMQVDEFMRSDVVINRYKAEQLRADMLQFAHDIQMDERDLKHLELQYQQVEADISGNYAGQGLRMWSYVVQHMLPIKGLLGGSK